VPPRCLQRPTASSPCGILHDFAALPVDPYSYLLGLYLGDGCISKSHRVWRMRIVLDTNYPAIITRCREAIDMHLEIPWTRSSKRDVSICRRTATARMDEFIGPKAIAVPWTNVHYTA
jgi:hypothetical protein